MINKHCESFLIQTQQVTFKITVQVVNVGRCVISRDITGDVGHHNKVYVLLNKISHAFI
jgi:hypothetical protein